MRELDSQYSLAGPRVTSQRVSAAETIVLDLESERYYTLNETGTRIWDCLAEGSSLDNLAKQIADEFRVPKPMVSSDMVEMLDDLVSAGLLESATQPQRR